MKKSELIEMIRESVMDLMSNRPKTDLHDIPESVQNRTERFVMSVPNDATGQAKIRALKALFGKDYKIQLRGRHSDRKAVLGTKYTPGSQNDIPPDKAEWIAVYADPKDPNLGKLPVTQLDEPDDSEMDPAFKDPANSRNLSHPHPAG